jgi:organic radical activating enzyme
MSCTSKTYCPYPFIGVSLQPNRITLPCGQYMDVSHFKENVPINDARNNSHMQEMRFKMLNNQINAGCQCPAEENVGIKSMRQHALDRFGYHPFGKIKTAEIFFDNVCNLKCRMCASPYSHLWFDEEQELYGTTISSTKYLKNDLYKELDVNELEEVKIYGGEPLRSLEAEDFFKKLIDADVVENISIEMSTNATTLPKTYTLEVFKKCKELKVNLSVDGYKELNEFIRSGSKWEDILTTFKFFEELISERGNKKTLIIVHSAISVYNINLMYVLDNFIINNYPNFVKTYQMVQFPVVLNVQNFPDDYKSLIRNVSQDIQRYLKEPGTNYFNHFLNFHEKLNAIRKEDLKECNPFLHNYILRFPHRIDSKVFFINQISKLTGHLQSE